MNTFYLSLDYHSLHFAGVRELSAPEAPSSSRVPAGDRFHFQLACLSSSSWSSASQHVASIVDQRVIIQGYIRGDIDPWKSWGRARISRSLELAAGSARQKRRQGFYPFCRRRVASGAPGLQVEKTVLAYTFGAHQPVDRWRRLAPSSLLRSQRKMSWWLSLGSVPQKLQIVSGAYTVFEALGIRSGVDVCARRWRASDKSGWSANCRCKVKMPYSRCRNWN